MPVASFVAAQLPGSVRTSYRRLAAFARHLNVTPNMPQPESQLRQSATAAKLVSTQELSKLTNVLNARDLAEATPLIKPGRLYRSGSPSHASVEDVLILRQALGVRQMLDFRSAEERQEDSAWSLMLSNGVAKAYVEGEVIQVSIDHNADLAGVELEDIQLHQLPLLDRREFVWALVRRLPFAMLAQGLFWKVVGQEEKMNALLLPEINRRGLLLVYQILMETGAANILRALQLLTRGAEQRQPQLFFCMLGKDRTGVLAALVLAASGATREEIVADYARSDGVNKVALGGIEKDESMQKIDPKLFSRAPPEIMEQLLQYTEERYGGMKQYMQHIGFSLEEQGRLREALTAGEW